MSSCFLEILRWIICCEDDKEEERRLYKPPVERSHRTAIYVYPHDPIDDPLTSSPHHNHHHTCHQSSDNRRRYENEIRPKPSPVFVSSKVSSSSNKSVQTTPAADSSRGLLKSSLFSSPSPPPISSQTQTSSQTTVKPLHSAVDVGVFNHLSKSLSSSDNQSNTSPVLSKVSSSSHRCVQTTPPVAVAVAVAVDVDSSRDLLKSSSSFSSPSPPPISSQRAARLHSAVNKSLSSSSSKASPISDKKERYEIPKELEEQIEKDIVPAVLRMPLSPSTYADYFATLLYAEDFYIEKWSKFLLSGVTLELQSREKFENLPEKKKANKAVSNKAINNKKKPFVTFVIDLIPEKRPFLLSRDFVFLKRCDRKSEPFKGILFRVVKSRTVLVEFKEDFHSQHSPSYKYDVSFSFNRVCLKRSHEAISAAKDHSLHDILFPKMSPIASASMLENFAIRYNKSTNIITNRILNHQGRIPYLIEGQFEAILDIIQEAILKIYKTSPNCRILVCAHANWSCDELMQSLLNKIPQAKLFRANAAFRDYDLVPDDIIQQSLYEGECFTCPSLYELQNFKVTTSTFVSSFRLHAKGIDANHFTHIFLMDASSAVEPEVVIPLAHFVGKNTVTIVTGSSGCYPIWVRSDIGRKHGLKKSYFQRLLEREPYSSWDPMYITHV